MSGKPIRIGLIGASRVATYAVIAPAARLDGVEVVAVAARDVERARDYARTHGIGRVHPDYAALCRDPEVDLVYIGTPPASHREQTLAAVHAGKAVLVEKPFTMNAAEATDIFRAARARGVAVFEAMHSLHHPMFARLLDILRSGVLGPLRRIDAEFSMPIERHEAEFRWQARLGGGALMDLGVYPLAWVRRVLGEEFQVVRASADVVDGVDSGFEAEISFACGVLARVRSSMGAASRTARMSLEGERGTLDAINPLAPQFGNSLILRVDGREKRETVEGPTSYQAQLAAVRDAMSGDASFPWPAEATVASMEAIDGVRAAF